MVVTLEAVVRHGWNSVGKVLALGQIEHHSFSMDMHIQFPNEGEINDRHMFVGI